MTKFNVNDRVAVTRKNATFPKLRGMKGTVVKVIPKTALTMEMIDVQMDNVSKSKFECIPFFPHEIELL